MSDPEASFAAFRKLDLSVQIITRLNRTALLTARHSYILPCLGRTELDEQHGVPQSVTVEDSMSMVHASSGRLKPASDLLRSQPAIIAAMARATLPDSGIAWEALPDFRDFNRRIRQPGGFRLTVHASERRWDTKDGKAHFLTFPGTDEDDDKDVSSLVLTTIRSHDQYNTTIYGLNDRYRGVTGRRDVVFVNEHDLAELGLAQGDRVDLVTKAGRVLAGQTAVNHPIARGSVAAYYPEANCLLALGDYDAASGTPSYKSIPIRLRAAAG